jgi:alkanesulfonate monooxygenase SsuD/methylene tetrahydromethanopterin reductase-like flavin-dependent oxidoreductase (luciferase family)
MRFAIKTRQVGTSWANLLDTWREIDQNPVFESAWLFDHLYWEDSRHESQPCLEAWTVLSALAMATSRVRLGVMVSPLSYRHIAVFASSVASLDIISGGRLELGVGSGWNELETSMYGLELGPLRQRFDRFEESIEALVRLLRDDVAELDGTYVTLRRARREPKPVQAPHPPLTIGGGGERRTLPLVAKYGDCWNLSKWDPDLFTRKREVLREACLSSGRDFTSITCSVQQAGPADGDFRRRGGDEWQAMAERGVDLVVVVLNDAFSPLTVANLAKAITEWE